MFLNVVEMFNVVSYLINILIMLIFGGEKLKWHSSCDTVLINYIN